MQGLALQGLHQGTGDEEGFKGELLAEKPESLQAGLHERISVVASTGGDYDQPVLSHAKLLSDLFRRPVGLFGADVAAVLDLLSQLSIETVL